MAGLVNWGQPRIPDSSNELASISNMLTAFGENRFRAQQAAAAKARQEAQMAEEVRRNHALETQAAATLGETQRFHDATLQGQEAGRAFDREKEARSTARTALPNVLGALESGNEDQARALGSAAGIDIRNRELGPDDAMRPQFMGADPRRTLAIPGAGLLEFDIEAGKRAREAKAQEASGKIGSLGGNGVSRHQADAVKYVNSLVSSGQLKPEEAGEAITKRMQFLEGESGSNFRAQLVANERRDKLNIGRGVFDPQTGAQIGMAATPHAAEAVNKGAAAVENIRTTIRLLRESYSKNGRVNPLGAEAATRDTLNTQLAIAYKTAAELGALSGPDMGLVEKARGGGGAMYARDPIPALDALEKSLKAGQATTARSRGVRAPKVDLGSLDAEADRLLGRGKR